MNLKSAILAMVFPIGLAAQGPLEHPNRIAVANAGSTGTTLNKLAKLTGAPATAVITATTDTGGAVGIVVAGAGTTGSATIQLHGLLSCVFDGATVAGDYVQISATTAGDCHDAGAAYPASGEVVGRVLSTNGGGGTYTIDLFPPEIQGSPSGTPGTGGFGTGSWFQEIPAGLLNGSNAVFNLTYAPCPVYSILELDGVTQDPYVDYSLASDGTITYAIAPKSSDAHVAWYFRCALAGGGGGGGGSLGARQFSSSGSSVRWSDISATSITADLSIGMWISLPTNSVGILLTRDSSHVPFQMDQGRRGNGHVGTISYCHTYSGGSGPECLTWNDAVPVGTWTAPAAPTDGWHYLGLTRDGTAKTVSLYVGDASSVSLVSTQSYTHTPDAATGGNGLWMGDFPGGCSQCEYSGAMQEHYIWSGKLTAAQHLQAAQGAVTSTGLQLKCLMGRNPEVDLSSNADSGTLADTSLVTGH